MFRDGKIVELFLSGTTKCSYIINSDICPYFKPLLDQALKEAPYFARSFDKSYNSTVKKGADGHDSGIIQFWDNSTNMVSTRSYSSKFLRKVTAVDVHTNI